MRLAITMLGGALLATACGGAAAEGGPLPTPPAGAIAVEMQDYAFSPAGLDIPAGTTVAFINSGDAPHTATRDGAFDTGEVKAGAMATQTFDSPGTYAFVCTFHPEMTGTVTVTDPAVPSPPAPSPSAPAPSAAPGSPTQGAEPSPTGAPGPEANRFSVVLEQATPHAVTAEVIDWTGAIVDAVSGTPGDGASVPIETLVVTNDDPQTLRLTWSGGPCDGNDTVVLDPDGRTVTVVSLPCAGDAIAFDRVLLLRFASPVDATTLDPRFQSGGDSPG